MRVELKEEWRDGRGGCRVDDVMMTERAAAHSQGCGQHTVISLVRVVCKHVTINKYCSLCENSKLELRNQYSCLHTAVGHLHGGGVELENKNLKTGMIFTPDE